MTDIGPLGPMPGYRNVAPDPQNAPDYDIEQELEGLRIELQKVEEERDALRVELEELKRPRNGEHPMQWLGVLKAQNARDRSRRP